MCVPKSSQEAGPGQGEIFTMQGWLYFQTLDSEVKE